MISVYDYDYDYVINSILQYSAHGSWVSCEHRRIHFVCQKVRWFCAKIFL